MSANREFSQSKEACYYYLQLSGFLVFELYPVAEAYHRKKHAEHNQKVTKAALKNNGDVADVLGHVGLFLTRFDTDALARTCRAGADAANLNYKI